MSDELIEWHPPTVDELIAHGNVLAGAIQKLTLELVNVRRTNEMSPAMSEAFSHTVEWQRMIREDHYRNVPQ